MLVKDFLNPQLFLGLQVHEELLMLSQDCSFHGSLETERKLTYQNVVPSLEIRARRADWL